VPGIFVGHQYEEAAAMSHLTMEPPVNPPLPLRAIGMRTPVRSGLRRPYTAPTE